MVHPNERVWLNSRPAVVVAAMPPSPEPCVIVGAAYHPSIGHAVAIGAGTALPNAGPLAFIAHISPADARSLAEQLRMAADKVEANGGGDPIAEAGKLDPGGDDPLFFVPDLPGGLKWSPQGQDSPPISVAEASPDNPEGLVTHKPEFLGVSVQVQHPLGEGRPPCDRPGMLGVSSLAAPDGDFRVMVGLTNADGTSMAAILSPEEYVSFGECYVEAGSGLARPEGNA
jgi:hypothetical protein